MTTLPIATQLEDIEEILAGYEQQYGLTSMEFLQRYDAGRTDDRMDYVEWAALTKMAQDLRTTLARERPADRLAAEIESL